MNWKVRIIFNVILLDIAILLYFSLCVLLTFNDMLLNCNIENYSYLLFLCKSLHSVDCGLKIVVSLLCGFLVIIYCILLFKELKKFGYKGTWSFVVYNKINNTDHVITQGEMQNYTLSEIIDHMKKMATSKMKWGSKYVTYYDTNHYKVVFEITDFDLDCKKEFIHGEYY